jgi:hypothetical protein
VEGCKVLRQAAVLPRVDHAVVGWKWKGPVGATPTGPLVH